MRKYGHWIDGVETTAADFIERRSPGDGELIAAFAAGTADDMAAAVKAASDVFEARTWADMPAGDRSKILNRWADLIEANAERLAPIEALESGKPIKYAHGEIGGSIDMIRFAASLGLTSRGDAITSLGENKLGLVTQEPLGVVGMIVPWNFPMVCLFQKLPFALAAGCSAVIKPSELTSGTALEVAKLAAEAGIPDGVINVVTGAGDVVGEALVRDPRVRLVSFTGSTRVGSQIGAKVGERIGRVALELGGKGANVVFADADIEAAVDGVLFGLLLNMGEECAQGARLIIEKSIAESFVEELCRRSEKVRVRHPMDPEGDVGALIHEGHLESVLRHIERAKEDGAKIAIGGTRLTEGDLANGFYIGTTVVTDVKPDMSIFREEVFGPVLTVTTFETLDEAVALANDTEYGLANGVWSKNIDTLHLVARRLRSGTVYANTYFETSPHMPFGGYGNSGVGRELGLRALDEFVEYKSTFLRIGERPHNYPHTL
ncbi:aldehyde dehydrogenase family protein [Croceicoccus bisphenolivorans]|uniref:aldehyde dehydrogenase family protein n=1 Tax=Croceicoccus bisphenolivorans TaxID=1783232 RepID=UPI000836A00D|nr:aldehyde dehydrogenase family protein [Croceicoccus bisphenolivorans]